MAEVLLKREQTGVGDMAWKPGDIVDIREDGFAWGMQERNITKFVIIRITGITPEQLVPYRAALRDPILLDPDTGQRKQIGRRRFWIDRTKLPGNLRNEIETNGFLEFTWEQVRDYLYDRVDGLPETDVVL